MKERKGENKREREKGVSSEKGRSSLCSHFKGDSEASRAFQSGLIGDIKREYEKHDFAWIRGSHMEAGV